MATPIWCKLLEHSVRAAASRTFCTAGTSRAMRIAMIAMTTSSSIKVNACLRFPWWTRLNGIPFAPFEPARARCPLTCWHQYYRKQAMKLQSALACAGFCVVASILTGCGEEAPKVAPPQTPVVPVSQPVERTVTDYADFTGRTAAVESVDIRPRATGYLVKMPFKEGSEVKAGDVLFEIDPRPYEAQVEQAEAQVKLNE